MDTSKISKKWITIGILVLVVLIIYSSIRGKLQYPGNPGRSR